MTHHSPGHNSPGNSITVRLRYADIPGYLGRITSAIGQAFGEIGAVDVVDTRENQITRDLTINTHNVEHGERIVAALREIPELDILGFHDDQHGTAIVVLAALTNALKLVGKTVDSVRVVVNGAGAAGAAIARLLPAIGVEDLIVYDREGPIHRDRANLNPLERVIANHTNHDRAAGDLADVIPGADVFIGVSSRNVLSTVDVKQMAIDAIVFALANPDPEIAPEDAAGHAAVIATGRSDYPNQINNVLCFPGLFRGLLDVRAHGVNNMMKVAAAEAIAGIISENELHADYIVPSVFDRRVAPAVAQAVTRTALETGQAKRVQVPGLAQSA